MRRLEADESRGLRRHRSWCVDVEGRRCGGAVPFMREYGQNDGRANSGEQSKKSKRDRESRVHERFSGGSAFGSTAARADDSSNARVCANSNEQATKPGRITSWATSPRGHVPSRSLGETLLRSGALDTASEVVAVVTLLGLQRGDPAVNSAVHQSAGRAAKQRQTGSARVGWHHRSPQSCSELRSSWSSRNSHRDRHKDRPCRRPGDHPARGRAKPVPRRRGDAQRSRLYEHGRENAPIPHLLPGTGKAVATAPRGVPGKPRRGSNGCARVVSLGRMKVAHKG
jgi:hypothetical protein